MNKSVYLFALIAIIFPASFAQNVDVSVGDSLPDVNISSPDLSALNLTTTNLSLSNITQLPVNLTNLTTSALDLVNLSTSDINNLDIPSLVNTSDIPDKLDGISSLMVGYNGEGVVFNFEDNLEGTNGEYAARYQKIDIGGLTGSDWLVQWVDNSEVYQLINHEGDVVFATQETAISLTQNIYGLTGVPGGVVVAGVDAALNDLFGDNGELNNLSGVNFADIENALFGALVEAAGVVSNETSAPTTPTPVVVSTPPTEVPSVETTNIPQPVDTTTTPQPVETTTVTQPVDTTTTTTTPTTTTTTPITTITTPTTTIQPVATNTVSTTQTTPTITTTEPVETATTTPATTTIETASATPATTTTVTPDNSQ